MSELNNRTGGVSSIDISRLRRRWLIFSIGGLVLIGAGMSFVGEAVIRKSSGEAWFLLGTLGLVVLNSGISFVGQGVIEKVKLDRSRSE